MLLKNAGVFDQGLPCFKHFHDIICCLVPIKIVSPSTYSIFLFRKIWKIIPEVKSNAKADVMYSF